MSLPFPYRPVYIGEPAFPLIVLEGVSAVGKSTLAGILAERLKGAGIHTLPLPHSDWSRAVNTKLRPLPQFAFYLSGVLHGSDSIRRTRQLSPVIADRYVSSVIACHAAVHGLDVDMVTELLAPFRSYLEVPTYTFYLCCSEASLRERLAHKQDVKDDDIALLRTPGRLAQLVGNFEAVADSDPTAVLLDTDGRTPDDLADRILDHLAEALRAQSHRH
ncbi:thymidylate kinase [Streptomyces sp. PSKA30]|uniref:dTMP kinase n=1 Tax=Streptomyces sp. PSKA30 TaxID=2874597 RepID=UPI001CD08A2C|nr:thymidylate kinase [Streptomyces sp. PSKA30]MBZ9645161.1 thymidylate kinase [Streptomyces sp. PSKA30]